MRIILSVLSPVQNLTFEDIHAVRTYEKAWVLWVTASQNCPRSDGFINIVDCMLLFALHPPPYVKASCKLHKFCKFFYMNTFLSWWMDHLCNPVRKYKIKKGKKRIYYLPLAWCSDMVLNWTAEQNLRDRRRESIMYTR